MLSLRSFSISILLLTALCFSPSSQCGKKNRKNAAEIQSEAARQGREQELKLWCAANCASEWGAWQGCSLPCGGGVQVRSREHVKHDWCPDENCAASQRETRPCNEGCPLGGYPAGGGCSCPPTRGGLCCERELFCPYPGRPDHGNVEGTWPAGVGSSAIYSCDDGFQITTNAGQTCNKNDTSGEAEWTGPRPRCEALECDLPTLFPHSQILNLKPMYAFGETIMYTCAEGYTLVGPQTRDCVESPTGAKFSGADPVCQINRCEDPGLPTYGMRDGDDLRFGSTIRFTCEEGYKRVGSEEIRCLASGRWLGNIPTCEEIECEAPYDVEHARVRVRRRSAAQLIAVYMCEEGFEVAGVSEMTCNEYGYWDGEIPRCNAINCGDPGTPEFGFANSMTFTHPSNITYRCQKGYIMRGPATISCQQSGTWSTTVPQCVACELKHYEVDGACVSCAPNSHTLSVASTSKLNCLCDEGYAGEPGEQCVQIRCAELMAPENGVMLECDNTYLGQCSFTCNDGYIMERGNSIRTCQGNGAWDGSPAFCSPCPVDAYKFGESQCNPCPTHSHTDASAQMLDGCICDDGYQGENGGPCTDVDECAEGRGPCEDECQNSIGSYTCICNIPGYKNDPADFHHCIPEHQCQNLTTVDAPQNGGLVCHWYQQMNSQFCAVRCNPHFDLPDRGNDYETCGPATNFEWSFRVSDPTAGLPPCIKEFFPGIRLQADLFYFTSQCDQMTDEEVEATKQAFADVLNENKICERADTQLCEIKDMGIICGRVTRRRRRRGVEEILQSVDIGFNVTAMEAITSPDDCTLEVCRLMHLPDASCDRYCVSAYNRFMRAAVQFAERKMETLYATASQRENMVIHTANRVFEPAEDDSLSTSGMLAECDPGMAFNGEHCYPCPVGMYLDTANITCVSCPIGQYQDTEGQEQCESCTLGTYAPEPGMEECMVCPRGTYGTGCVGRCSCSHGNCDPFTGRCTCLPGWTGDNCDIDKDGCEYAQCADGVSCHDNPAPEEGYTCGDCPDGYTGDGHQCTPASPNALIRPARSTSVIGHILY